MEESTSQLVTEIAAWLETFPSQETILEYVRALPEEHYATVRYAGIFSLDTLYEVAHLDWQSNALNVPEVLEPIDELEMIDSLARYNTRSVFISLQKNFPKLVVPAAVPDLHEWAGKYLQRWRTINTLLAAPKYLRRLVDAHTLLNSASDLTQFEKIKEIFSRIQKEDEKTVAESRQLGELEVEQQQALLTELKFFQPDYIVSILDPFNYPEKVEVITSFLSGIEILTTIGVETAQKNPAAFDATVWRYAYDHQVTDSLVYLQSNYRKSTPEAKQIQQWLATAFTLNTIASDQFDTNLTTFARTLEGQGKQDLARQLAIFLSFSPIARIVTEPLDIGNMLEQIDLNKGNSVRVTDIILTAANDIPDEQHRQIAVRLFNTYYKILRFQ